MRLNGMEFEYISIVDGNKKEIARISDGNILLEKGLRLVHKAASYKTAEEALQKANVPDLINSLKKRDDCFVVRCEDNCAVCVIHSREPFPKLEDVRELKAGETEYAPD